MQNLYPCYPCGGASHTVFSYKFSKISLSVPSSEFRYYFAPPHGWPGYRFIEGTLFQASLLSISTFIKWKLCASKTDIYEIYFTSSKHNKFWNQGRLGQQHTQTTIFFFNRSFVDLELNISDYMKFDIFRPISKTAISINLAWLFNCPMDPIKPPLEPLRVKWGFHGVHWRLV